MLLGRTFISYPGIEVKFFGDQVEVKKDSININDGDEILNIDICTREELPDLNLGGLQNAALSVLKIEVEELSSRLDYSEREKDVLQRRLNETLEEKEQAQKRLRIVGAAHESRITELQCVIAEISKKLKTKEEDAIGEEKHNGGSDLSFQEGSVYNSEMEVMNYEIESAIEFLKGDEKHDEDIIKDPGGMILHDSSPVLTVCENNMRERAIKRIKKVKKVYNKEMNDRKCRGRVKFKEGDYVMIRNVTISGVNRKMMWKFKGPFEVRKVLPNDRFVIGDIEGFQVSQLPFEGTFDKTKLKRWLCSSTGLVDYDVEESGSDSDDWGVVLSGMAEL